MKIKLTLVFLVSAFIACQDTSLRKITEEEVIERIVNRDMPDPAEVVIKNTDGDIISVDSLKQLEMTGAYFEDFYANSDNEIVEVVVRPKTAADDAMMKKIQERVKPPVPELQTVAIDCDQKAKILQDLYERDQSMRTQGGQVDPKVDFANLEVVVSLIEKCGMPTLEEVSKEQMAGIWAVLQHAIPHYQKKYIPLLEASAKNGDISWEIIAVMKDRALMYDGQPQIYGSQISNGKLYELAEPEYVNQRRATMGMGPIEPYLERFGINFDVEQQTK
ncbi:DUF6624 domain-containing protein [Flavilitoribacter nigricans]|uniref:Uncharacterized protein n=1 Tax=Flavilitoribacter nigricans (strain ATCC 23147 / DSM 23189 / NBRC 102662 / NCIMB 1420 / SS-2) TaxID=1122177 RepID=A0A2D0NBV7_FLAN2|nr:DUF6624 domain-containing protein [Flavilitoribacter nigricans]PHN05253.1 hypothetical protein CRP01_17190 [Flavilitoribacter nigricans DSM 23189 = NBRC 102662]